MSPEFLVNKIVAVSFGGKDLKQFTIFEDSNGDRFFVPKEALDKTVGEICVGSRLDIQINPETAQVVKVSQLPYARAEDTIATADLDTGSTD